MTDYTYWHRSRALSVAEMRLEFGIRRPTSFLAITGLDGGYGSAPYRTPLWTRHMLGVIEAERDHRRRAKGLR